ncbi:MAG: hypothetical protein ACM3SV_04835 [Betaproteobacteria bacterium]
MNADQARPVIVPVRDLGSFSENPGLRMNWSSIWPTGKLADVKDIAKLFLLVLW